LDLLFFPPSLTHSLCSVYCIAMDSDSAYKYPSPTLLKSRQLWPNFSPSIRVRFPGNCGPFSLSHLSVSCVPSSLLPSAPTLAIDTSHRRLQTHAFRLVHRLLTPAFRPSRRHMPAAVGITTRAHRSPVTPARILLSGTSPRFYFP
jgi:hypothetical protein